MSALVLVAAAVLAAPGGRAAADGVDPCGGAVDLPTLLALALETSPGLEGARARADAEVRVLESAQPSLAPVLRAGARVWPYGQQTDPTGATREQVRYHWFAQLRFPVMSAATAGSSRELLAAATTRGELSVRLARSQLFRDVATAYAAARASAVALPSHAAVVAARQREVAVLRTRAGLSATTVADVGRAEQAVAAASTAREDSLHTGEAALTRLAALTGTDAPATVSCLSQARLGPIVQRPLARSADEAAALAREGRLDVQVVRAEAAQSRAEGGLAWRHVADIDVGVAYNRGSAGTLEEVAGFAGLVEVTFPLDTIRRVRAERAGRDGLARAAELEAARLADAVAAEARNAFVAHAQAVEHVAVARGRLEAARSEAQQLDARRGLVLTSGQGTTMPELLLAELAVKEAELVLADAVAQTEVTYVALAAAMGETPLGAPDDAPRPAPSTALVAAVELPGPNAGPATPASPRARGLWVWKTRDLLRERGAAEALRAFCGKRDLTEVYLSVPEEVLADERLAQLVSTLRGAGLRVEALIGDATWYLPHLRAPLLKRIDDVAQYNASHPEARFTGIHLDVEPHQLPENKGRPDLPYLPELVDMLAEGRDAAVRAGLTLAADVPRKLLHASAADARALVRACPRLVFMMYELKDRPGANASALVETSRKALEWCDGAGACEVVVGVRWSDYGDRTPEMLARLESALAPVRGFAGWAVHDYASARAAPPARGGI
jgi:outer membrane protein TolC